MVVLGIVAAFTAVILIDLPSLLKIEQRKKTVIVYCLIIFLGLSISIFQVIYDHSITPSKFIESIVKSIVG